MHKTNKYGHNDTLVTVSICITKYTSLHMYIVYLKTIIKENVIKHSKEHVLVRTAYTKTATQALA